MLPISKPATWQCRVETSDVITKDEAADGTGGGMQRGRFGRVSGQVARQVDQTTPDINVNTSKTSGVKKHNRPQPHVVPDTRHQTAVKFHAHVPMSATRHPSVVTYWRGGAGLGCPAPFSVGPGDAAEPSST